MSSTPPTSKRSSSASTRKGDKSGVRVNRAQVRAMEARAASTRVDQFSVDEDEPEFAEMAAQVGGAAALMAARRRPVARPVFISRAQEYAFIRSDMRRLIITASALFVVMIVLLFILD